MLGYNYSYDFTGKTWILCPDCGEEACVLLEVKSEKKKWSSNNLKSREENRDTQGLLEKKVYIKWLLSLYNGPLGFLWNLLTVEIGLLHDTGQIISWVNQSKCSVVAVMDWCVRTPVIQTCRLELDLSTDVNSQPWTKSSGIHSTA